MKKRNGNEERLYKALEESVRGCGAELIDLRMPKENGIRFLRLFIDKKGGVGIDDCERVSLTVDPILDEMGEDSHDYLEVQSPGLDRPLEELRDFLLHLEEEVEVRLYQKRGNCKEFQGRLVEADEEGFEILEADGKRERFSYPETAIVKRAVVF